RLAYGGAHDAEPAQSTLLAVPVHRVATEDLRQRPERHAELAEEQRAFHVRDARRHVGHEERGPNAVGTPISQEDAPDRDSLFDRRAFVLQLIPLGEVRREQLRRRSEAFIEQASKLGRVVNRLHIRAFRDGQADGTMPARRPCRASFGHDPPPSVHRGSWPFCQVMSACCRYTLPPKTRDSQENRTTETSDGFTRISSPSVHGGPPCLHLP